MKQILQNAFPIIVLLKTVMNVKRIMNIHARNAKMDML